MGETGQLTALYDAVGFYFIVILRPLSLLLSDLIILHHISLCPECVIVIYLIYHLTWVSCHWIRWF